MCHRQFEKRASRALATFSSVCWSQSVASHGDYFEGNHAGVFILASLLKINKNKRKNKQLQSLFPDTPLSPKDYQSLAIIILILTVIFQNQVGRRYFAEHVFWSYIYGFVFNGGIIL